MQLHHLNFLSDLPFTQKYRLAEEVFRSKNVAMEQFTFTHPESCFCHLNCHQALVIDQMCLKLIFSSVIFQLEIEAACSGAAL